MLRVAFAARLEAGVRAHLGIPCTVVTDDERGTEGTLAARAEVIAENIHRVARGEPPVNLIALSP